MDALPCYESLNAEVHQPNDGNAFFQYGQVFNLVGYWASAHHPRWHFRAFDWPVHFCFNHLHCLFVAGPVDSVLDLHRHGDLLHSFALDLVNLPSDSQGTMSTWGFPKIPAGEK